MNPATCSDNLQRHILEGLVKVGRYFFMLWLSLWHVAKQQPFGTFRIPALIPNIMLLSHRFQSENSRCPHSGHFTSLLPWYATGGLNITFYNMYIIYIYIYILTYIHTYVHTYRQTYIRTYIHTYIHLHTYILTYLHTDILTYLHTYIHTYTQTYIHTHIYIYIHLQTYTHAYIHTDRTYIHTYTYIYTYLYIYICAHYVIGWSI